MKVLITIHRPQGTDPAQIVTEQVMRDIDTLNEEMVSAGVRLFVGGLQPPATANAIGRTPAGDLTVTEGAYLTAAQFVDGLWVLEVANMEEAIAWGRRAAIACRAGVEVRPFY